MLKSKITPVVAVTALAIAVFGSTPLGHAATRIVLGKNTVGTAQLKKNAVTGAKVKNGTLTAAKFKAGQLPSGPKGDPGAQGAKGDPGSARAYATVLMAFGQPNIDPQRSHNAVAVRRVAGDPSGHFCLKIQGVPKVETSPGYYQLATAPVASTLAANSSWSAASAATGWDGSDCSSDEIEVMTFVAPGTMADHHFMVIAP